MRLLIKIRFLLIIIICIVAFIPNDAVAGIFDPPTTDKSIEYLAAIFGGKIGGLQLGISTESSGFLGSLFQVFNGIILAVAMVILTYVSSVSIIHTAHQGEVMGKKWSSIWIPLRSSVGLLLLAPIPGSGYSLIQVTVMWIILNGIGAADRIWNLVLDNLSQGISTSIATQIQNSDTQALKSNGKNLAIGMLKSLVCMRLVTNGVDAAASIEAPFGPYFTTPSGGNGSPLAGYLNFGANDPITKDRQNICGSVGITVGKENLSGFSLTTAQQNAVLEYAYAVKREALTSMISIISPIANDIADSGSSISSFPSGYSNGILYNAVLSYVTSMSKLNQSEVGIAVGASPQQNKIGAPIDDLRKAGWILAGASYILFTKKQQQNLMSTATVAMTPSCPLINNNNVDANKLKSATLGPMLTVNTFQPYSSALSDGNVLGLFNDQSGANTNGNFSVNIDRWLYLIAAVLSVGLMLPAIGFCEGGIAVLNSVVNLQSPEPLISIAFIGGTLMKVAEMLWAALLGLGFLATLLTSVMSCASPLGYATSAILTMIIPLLTSLTTLAWTIGATMAFYLPLTPLMIFSTVALSWFISVIESIVAAPIVSLGLIMPAEEEIGAIKPALGMITNIFLRPMLMLIGLIFASSLFRMCILMVSEGFKNGLTYLSDAENGFSMFSWLPMLGLYLGFITALVNKCYSLIYHLPDKVLSWIGGPGEQTDISAVKEAKGGMDKGTEMGKGIGEAHAKKGEELLKNAGNKAQNAGRGGPAGGGAPGGGAPGGGAPGGGAPGGGSPDGGASAAATDLGGAMPAGGGASGGGASGGGASGGGAGAAATDLGGGMPAGGGGAANKLAGATGDGGSKASTAGTAAKAVQGGKTGAALGGPAGGAIGATGAIVADQANKKKQE